jgi:hypothetical protein
MSEGGWDWAISLTQTKKGEIGLLSLHLCVYFLGLCVVGGEFQAPKQDLAIPTHPNAHRYESQRLSDARMYGIV